MLGEMQRSVGGMQGLARQRNYNRITTGVLHDHRDGGLAEGLLP